MVIHRTLCIGRSPTPSLFWSIESIAHPKNHCLQYTGNTTRRIQHSSTHAPLLDSMAGRSQQLDAVVHLPLGCPRRRSCTSRSAPQRRPFKKCHSVFENASYHDRHRLFGQLYPIGRWSTGAPSTCTLLVDIRLELEKRRCETGGGGKDASWRHGLHNSSKCIKTSTPWANS